METANVYCEQCVKLKQGTFSGDPNMILCKCQPNRQVEWLSLSKLADFNDKSIHEKLDKILELLKIKEEL